MHCNMPGTGFLALDFCIMFFIATRELYNKLLLQVIGAVMKMRR